MNREMVERWCERGILVLVLGIMIFGPLALGAVRGLEFGIIEGLTAGVGVLWALRLWAAPRPQLLWPPICWAVLAFLGYAIARYFTADVEYIARHELLRVVVYTFLFFAVLNNLYGQESTRLISLAMIFLAMAISFYAIYQFFTHSPKVWWFPGLYPHRGTGTYICPNHLAGFLELLLPLSLAYTLTSRLSHLTKVFVGYASLVILAGIAVTISRGGWVASAIALLLFFGVLLKYREHRAGALLALVVLVGLGAFYLPKSNAIQARLTELRSPQGEINDEARFTLWAPAYRMWREHPWWGVGPAHFDVRFRSYRPEQVQATPDRVHNDYLNTLVDWGVVGATLVAAAWLLLGWSVLQTGPAVRPPSGTLSGKSGSNKFAFVVGGSVGLIALLAHSFVDFNFHIPANAILAVSLMALLASHVRFATDRFWFRAGYGAKAVLTLGLLGGAAVLATQGWHQGREFVWREKASRAPGFSVEQIALLKNALAVEPRNPETTLALAEAYRQESREGGVYYQGQEGVDYRELATNAMAWYAQGIKLNPWDDRNYAGYGWCLDWLDRTGESEPYFARAEELDPNNYFNVSQIALHYVQIGDYAAAKPLFERSMRLESRDNIIARNYLALIQQRMLEAATNQLRAKLDSASK